MEISPSSRTATGRLDLLNSFSSGVNSASLRLIITGGEIVRLKLEVDKKYFLSYGRIKTNSINIIYKLTFYPVQISCNRMICRWFKQRIIYPWSRHNLLTCTSTHYHQSDMVHIQYPEQLPG